MDSLHSNLWYRVANLKPQLRRHAEIRRHHYRGQRWYILQDRASGGAHRFSPAAHCFIAQMDGKRTVNDIWETVIRQLGDTAPSQEQAIQLLGQLHANDLLQCEIPPDDAELFSRHKQHKQSRLKQRLSAPLSVRIPLVDPERFLARWQHLARPLFTPAGLVIWLVVIGLAILLAGQHWTEITSDIFNRRDHTAEPVVDGTDLSGGEGAARARPRLRRQALGRGSPRDGDPVPGLHAAALRRRVGRLGLPGEAAPDAGGRCGHRRGALPGGDRHLRLDRGGARTGPPASPSR